jgi:hypothetical protein
MEEGYIMQKIEKEIEQRPHYYNTQLLREDDFLREQRFHINARRRHNLNLHGYGVVSGLNLVCNKDGTVTLNPGFAIDPTGNDMMITNPIRIDLKQPAPKTTLRIALYYEESDGVPNQNTVECFSWVTVAKETESRKGLTLALIHLDENGAFDDTDVDYSVTVYTGSITNPASVDAPALHPTLKRGWLRLPFRPVALVNVPEDETEVPPEFRVGATETVTPDPKTAGEKDRGAAGTMAIPIPPNATQITRLQIAGATNKGEIQLLLLIGGWDYEKKKHLRAEPLNETIPSESPFQKTFELKGAKLDPQYSTVSLWLRGTRRTRISLVAIEFAYFDQ